MPDSGEHLAKCLRRDRQVRDAIKASRHGDSALGRRAMPMKVSRRLPFYASAVWPGIHPALAARIGRMVRRWAQRAAPPHSPLHLGGPPRPNRSLRGLGDCNAVSARRCIQFLHEVGAVFSTVLTLRHRISDGFVGTALGNQLQHLTFAVGYRLPGRESAHLPLPR